MEEEIERLKKKIATMRALLWEWNCSAGPVWEYWRLADVGETEEDYKHLFDEDPDFDDDSEEVA